TGTESAGGALAPVFSPDGQSLAFLTRDDVMLKRVSVVGGSALSLGKAPALFGVSWTGDEVLFAQGGTQRGIMGVSANGGTPQVIVPVASDENAEGPERLPDGDTILLSIAKPGTGPERWDTGRIVGYSLKTGARKVLLEGAAAGHYLPSG